MGRLSSIYDMTSVVLSYLMLFITLEESTCQCTDSSALHGLCTVPISFIEQFSVPGDARSIKVTTHVHPSAVMEGSQTHL